MNNSNIYKERDESRTQYSTCIYTFTKYEYQTLHHETMGNIYIP